MSDKPKADDGGAAAAVYSKLYHEERAKREQLERELSAANARIAELEKDAARYRWLREHSTQPAEPWSTHSNPESLDDAIDAALRGILG